MEDNQIPTFWILLYLFLGYSFLGLGSHSRKVRCLKTGIWYEHSGSIGLKVATYAGRFLGRMLYI